MEKKVNSFMDIYSQFFAICQDKIVDKGEDSYAYNFNQNAGLISVFDGCGGSGGRNYEEFDNRTGAYIASRIASEKINDWFNIWSEDEKVLLEDKLLSMHIKKEIDEGLKEYLDNVKRKSFLKGSIHKDFPTTAVMCIFRTNTERECVTSNVLWCGDSRAYWLDNDGLHQLTLDDVEGEDAMSNIYNDGVLTNVISASSPYEIREYMMNIEKKGIMFVATDGCFGYLQSPMHFEYLILKNIVENNTLEEYEKKLCSDISSYAGDDATMCGVIFGFKNYDEVKEYFRKRYLEVKNEYIGVYEKLSDEQKQMMWEKYQIEYKRMLEASVE